MIDVFDLMDSKIDIQRFYAGGGENLTTPSYNDWMSWTKPIGCKFIYAIAIGCGGGGGGGFTGAAGSARGGGGGGGTGSIVTGLFPAFTLPNTLYIKVYR